MVAYLGMDGKHISYERFISLPYVSQYLYLDRYGEFLIGRQADNGSVSLFWGGSFFVEVFLADPASNENARFHAFTDPLLLEPYLERIDIQALLSQ